MKGDGLKCSGSLDQCCVKAFLSFSTLEATDEAEAGLGLEISVSSYHSCRIKDAAHHRCRIKDAAPLTAAG